MRFLVDAQLPATLARWLRGRGYDAEHVLERGKAQAKDLSLWRMALGENRILITKDEDFFILATHPRDEGRLLWLRMGNCRTRDLLSRLNADWQIVEAAFLEGQRIVEMR